MGITKPVITNKIINTKVHAIKNGLEGFKGFFRNYFYWKQILKNVFSKNSF